MQRDCDCTDLTDHGCNLNGPYWGVYRIYRVHNGGERVSVRADSFRASVATSQLERVFHAYRWADGS